MLVFIYLSLLFLVLQSFTCSSNNTQRTYKEIELEDYVSNIYKS